MTGSKTPLHFLVYDLSAPWLGAEELIAAYNAAFHDQPETVDNFLDRAALLDLRRDTYDYVVTSWDGTGSRPSFLRAHLRGLGIVFLSKAVILE